MTQKGGSGKTTLAVHVAVAAGEAGERVVIVDTDPQRSASTWGGSRQQDTPSCAGCSCRTWQRHGGSTS
jgi:chromosome partitioning protein